MVLSPYRIGGLLLCCLLTAGFHIQKSKTASARPTTIISTKDTTAPKAIEDSIYYSEPSISALHGKLIQKQFYGPPGFGENPKEDAHYTWFVLVLNKPIIFRADPRSSFNREYIRFSDYATDSDRIEHIDSIQIRDERTNPLLLSRVGKQVSLKGVLNISVLPSEQPPIILDFRDVK